MTVDNSTSQGVHMNRSGYSFNTITLKSAEPLEFSKFLEERIAPCSELYANTPVVLDVSELAYLDR